MKEKKSPQSKVYEHLQLVEKVISAFGIDPEKTRSKKPLQWIIYQGKTPIWFFLPHVQPFNEYFLQVTAPIIRMPEEHKGAFCKQLITLNSTLVGAAFIEKKGTVYLNANREAIDLSFEEAYKMVRRVLNYTDFYYRVQKNGLLNWPTYSSKKPQQPGQSSLS